MKYSIVLGAAAVALLSFAAPQQSAVAQVGGGTIGIGGQLGDPSGLSLKFYRGGGFGGIRAWDVLLAWDTNEGRGNWFFLNVHGHFERPLSGAPLNFFYGPGAFIGTIDVGEDDEVLAGISADFGLAYEIERFEIFGRLTPRLEIAPDTDGGLGLGIGARYYF